MRALLALLFAAMAGQAAAAVFNTPVVDKSSLTFVSRQMGVAVAGGFDKFTSQISFDPLKPETGKAQIDVVLSSIDTGNGEANDAVKGKSWFDVREYPVATFVSGSLKALGGNRYQATGRLTIKGKSRDVVVPFTASPSGFTLVLEGNIPVLRSLYGIGEGAWSDPSVLADEVQVHFHLTLDAAK
ncbi:MAG: YceI family protein [Sulfuriferula sp.]|nr:YceI family protein [Sulfuriferula sp.]